VEGVAGLRAAAAVGVETGDFEGEQVWIVAGVRPQELAGPEEQERAAIEVTDRLHRVLGTRPARVLLARPGTIPKTPNGKVQRARLREQIRDGSLAGSGRVLFPEKAAGRAP
jgi:fatty-acyl-CoA synthase